MMSSRMKVACSSKDQTKRLVNRDAKDRSNSVFHVPLPAPSCAECAEGLSGVMKFAEDLRHMCGAGTHATDKISSLLVGTSYQEIAGQFLQLQNQLEGSVDGIVSQVRLELENLIKQLGRDSIDKGGKAEDGAKGQGHRPEDLQLVTMGLVLMIQLQQQFLRMATEKLAHFTQHQALNNSNGLNMDAKLKPTGWFGGSQSTLTKEPQDVGPSANNNNNSGNRLGNGSPSNSTGQEMSKASSKSSNPGGMKPHSVSIWHKESEKEAGSSPDGHLLTAGQMSSVHVPAEVRGQGQGHAGGSQMLSGVHPQANSQTTANPVPSGMVSQEEIDIVIDMLSKATKYTTPPGGDSVEHTNVPIANTSSSAHSQGQGVIHPTSLLSKAPGSHLSTNGQHSFNMGMFNKDSQFKYGTRAAQHRQSDSFIVDSPVNNEIKMNTWPIRPHLREGTPPWHGSDGSQAGSYHPHQPNDTMVYQDLTFGYTAGGGTKYPLLPGLSPGPWSTAPEATVNKAWPVFPITRDGDMVPSQWTGVADSSSCSDESSSNSDIQWIMGVNLMGVMNVKRRHSSGGDTATTSSGGHINNINKSVDNLMETKSANTWPPKHPWSNRQGDGGLTPETSSSGIIKSMHKPLSPQWSDPLTTRSLAVWDNSGLTGSLSQQSFSNMSAGSNDFQTANTVSLTDEEKCF